MANTEATFPTAYGDSSTLCTCWLWESPLTPVDLSGIRYTASMDETIDS